MWRCNTVVQAAQSNVAQSRNQALRWLPVTTVVAMMLARVCVGGDTAAARRNETVAAWSDRESADQKVNWQLAYKTTSAVDSGTEQGWDADTIREVCSLP